MPLSAVFRELVKVNERRTYRWPSLFEGRKGMAVSEVVEAAVEHFWDLAIASVQVSPEVSKGAILELLETLKLNDLDVPQHFKRLFCLKCFSLFAYGKNCKIVVRSHRGHPNLKVIEYRCLECKNIQRVNCIRSRTPVHGLQDRELELSIPDRKKQQSRKLMMDLFK
jgi:RNase P subunit RPR2